MNKPQAPFDIVQNEDGFAVIDAKGRVVLEDVFAYHPNALDERNWVESVVAALNKAQS